MKCRVDSSLPTVVTLLAMLGMPACGVGVSRDPRGRDGSSDKADVGSVDRTDVYSAEPTSDLNGPADHLTPSAVDAEDAPQDRTDSGEDTATSVDVATAPDAEPFLPFVDAGPEGGSSAVDAADTIPPCPSAFHRCGGVCVSNNSPETCGSVACTGCVPPVNGTSTCDGTSCEFTCRQGSHRCGSTCAGDQDPAACGSACVACPADPNGSSQCIDGACRFQCRPGFHVCGTHCADDMSPESCGTSCLPCAIPSGGRALCVQGRCDQACLGSQRQCRGVCIDASAPCDGSCPIASHLCGDSCRANTSPEACGTRCTPCLAPAGSQATCDGVTCSHTCRTGFHACGNECPANDRSVACLTTKIVGNPMAYIDSDANEAIVAVSAAGHVIQVATGPSGAVATDLTAESAATVTSASDPWAYRRSDDVNAVLFRGTDGAVHELGRNPDWADSQLTTPFTAAPRAHESGTIRAYIRSDRRNAVVYRSEDNHLWELASNFGQSPAWFTDDLTSFTGGPNLAGDPMGYVRSDNRNAMVYRADDGHLHEMASNFGASPAWVDTDLTAVSGQTVLPAADPWAYRRPDGRSAVVYLGTDGQLHELSQSAAEPWTHQLLPGVSPAGPPAAFIRSDGKASIVYRSNDTAPGSLHQLILGTAWVDQTIDTSDQPAVGAVGVPFPHRGVRGSDSIVYQSTTGELFQRRLDPGGAWQLITY